MPQNVIQSFRIARVGGERDLGDVPGHGRVIEVLIDVVVDAAGHALEEIGHAVAPAAGRAPAAMHQKINKVRASL